MRLTLSNCLSATAALAVVATITSCNSTSSGPAPIPLPLPTAVAIPAAAPFTSATTVTPLLASASSFALPPAGGYSGSIDFSNATVFTPGTTVTTTLSNVAPTNVSTLSSELRLALAKKHITSASGAIVVLLYDDFVFSNLITYAKAPSFVLTLPAADIVDAAYYVALFDPTRPSLGWQLGFEGPGTITGSTIAFSSVDFSPFTFAANADYYFATFAISTSATPPTPAPSIAPIAPMTATPNPNGSASPTATPVPGGSSQPATPVPGGSSQPPTPVPGGSSQPPTPTRT